MRKLRCLETLGYGHPVTQCRIPKERDLKQNLSVRGWPGLLTEALQTKNSNFSRKKHKTFYFNFKYDLSAVHWLLTNTLNHGEELAVPRLVDKRPPPPSEFYGTKKCITIFTRACHRSLSRARSIKSTTPASYINIHINIILPCIPRSSKSFLSLSIPRQKAVCLSSVPIRSIWLVHLILLDLVSWIIFVEE